MADKYTEFVQTNFGKKVAANLGLPSPVELRRYSAGDKLIDGNTPNTALTVGNGNYATAVAGALESNGVEVNENATKLGALIIDVSAARQPDDLAFLQSEAAPLVKKLGRNARVVVLGTDYNELTGPIEVATQRGLDGFTRSLAKELRFGATANLVYAPVTTATESVISAVEFFVSGRSAFVDGQTVRLGGSGAVANPSADKPLEGKVAVVTGAARGIGAAIVEVLARDGATVVGVDVPQAAESLAKVVNKAGGTSLTCDVTDPAAADKILELCKSRFGGVDIVVHNAGITRDKLLVNMDAAKWGAVMAVNLKSIIQMNAKFLAEGGIREGGRVVCLSSQSGFAGNRGQTNYSTTKAAIIGLVSSTAPVAAQRGITINAVAPGLIESDMTAAMPFGTREAARRMSSLQQGGQPQDVAEAISWLASPASGAITGQTIRVCGQNMIGA